MCLRVWSPGCLRILEVSQVASDVSRYSDLDREIPAKTYFLAGIYLLKSPKPEYPLNPYQVVQL